MARYSKNSASKEKPGEAALAMARGTQKPGQTKEQTRLIAQGIQKGIALYKKQHAAKKRELDKNIKKVVASASVQTASVDVVAEIAPSRSHKLPWILLGLSWACFGLYYFFNRLG